MHAALNYACTKYSINAYECIRVFKRRAFTFIPFSVLSALHNTYTNFLFLGKLFFYCCVKRASNMCVYVCVVLYTMYIQNFRLRSIHNVERAGHRVYMIVRIPRKAQPYSIIYLFITKNNKNDHLDKKANNKLYFLLSWNINMTLIFILSMQLIID